MRYGNKIVALLLALTMSSTSLAQRERSDNEDEANDKGRAALTVAAVVLAIVAVSAGGYKIFKHLDNNKALRETAKNSRRARQAQPPSAPKDRATVTERDKTLQQEVRRAEHQAEQRASAEKVAREEQAHTSATENNKNLQQEVRRAEHQAEQRASAEKVAREEQAHTSATENNKDLQQEVRQAEHQAEQRANAEKITREEQAHKIARGETLQQAARRGKKMTVDEWRSIYDGRVAALEVEQAKKMQAVHEQYPKPRAIQKLADEHQRALERLRAAYDLAQNSTDGFPEVKYAPELANKISAIIAPTSLDKELSSLAKLGNLQEVVWKLEEHGFTSEATAMTKLIEDVLTNGEIISKDILKEGATRPQLVEFDSGLQGIFKGDYGQYDEWKARYDWPQREIAAYKFDQLLGLRVFPITVPRQLAEGSGSVQLFIDHRKTSFYRQRAAYAELIGITPDKPDMTGKAKNWTFFDLTMDKDTDAYGNNNIYPLSGRMIKIDAEQAFLVGGYENIGDELRKNPEEFYTDPDFIDHLDNISPQQLEEIFQPLFEPSKAEAIVKSLHENIRSYVDAAREIQP